MSDRKTMLSEPAPAWAAREIERLREIILSLSSDVDRARGQLTARDAEIERLREEVEMLRTHIGLQYAAEQAAEIERFKTDYALLTDSYRKVVSDAFRLSEEAEQAKQENEQLRKNRDYWMESCLKAQESRDTASTFLAAAETENKRLRNMLDDVLAEVELPQSIAKRVREALGNETL